jgi:hypothetical protein
MDCRDQSGHSAGLHFVSQTIGEARIVTVVVKDGPATITARANAVCRGHFPGSGCRCQIKLEKPLHTGHFKPAAA